MSKKIGVREVKRKLRRVVNEKGHEYQYIYPTYIAVDDIEVESDTCLYSDNKGNPSCIIGVLLSRVSPETFNRLHQYEWDTSRLHPISVDVNNLCGDTSKVNGVDLTDMFTKDAIALMIRTQGYQDNGSSWGVALDAASY